MAAPDWRDEKAAEAMGVQEREKVVADYVRAKCRDRTSTFDVEEVTDMVRIYGLKSLFRLLDEGLQSEVGRRGVLTNTAYACMHTAGMRCSQADEKNGEKLYQAHGKYMDEYLRGTVLPALNKLSGPPLLREFKRRWENHKIFTEWMRKLFLYLDRRGAYVGNFQQSTLTSKGIALFKEVVFDGKKGDLVDTIQIIANQEREGEQIDRALLRSVIELFLVMGISEVRDFKDIRDVKARAKDESAGSSSTYRDDFEAPFLRNTTEYYNAKAVEWFAVDTTPEYLAKCEAALIADQERVLAYLNPVTKPKLEGVIRDVLVKDRLRDLLNKPGSGARELLRDDRQEDLGRMYRMFRLVDGGLREFGLVFRAYLKERGAVIMDRRKDESTARLEAKKDPGTLDIPFVEDILALYDKYEASVKGVFEGNATFQEEFKNAWTHTMNSSAGPITLSQLLASYMDSVLRDSKAAESEQTHKMKECAKLTEYLDSKDIFQLYYEKLLCDRLLNEQTTSNDVENNTITFFKESKGAAFTAKMEGMVSDLVTTSANLSLFQDPFEEWARQEVAEGRHRILFTPTILCRGHWPQFPDLPGIQPVDDFARVAGVFDEFYKKQYSGGRKVTWEWARGKAELHVFLVDKAGNPDRKTVNMSMVQAFACLKFNSSPTFTRKALATELGLTEDVLDKVVKPMVSRGKKLPNGKVKKIPGLFKFKTDKATKAVTYTFNAGYTNPRREVEISVPNLTTSKAADSKRIDKGREFQLDAAIVRIMKTRQTSSHTELVAEVVKAIRLFRPQPADIKKRIESLIQKEFIERDEDDRKLYHYMA